MAAPSTLKKSPSGRQQVPTLPIAPPKCTYDLNSSCTDPQLGDTDDAYDMNQTATNDPLHKKLIRRMISVTVVSALWLLFISLFPLALLLLPPLDIFTGSKLSRSRFYLFLVAFLSFERWFPRALIKMLRVTDLAMQPPG